MLMLFKNIYKNKKILKFSYKHFENVKTNFLIEKKGTEQGCGLRAAYVDRTAIHQLLLIPEMHVVGGVGVVLAGRQSVQINRRAVSD